MAERAARPFDPDRDPASLIDTFLGLVDEIPDKLGARALVLAAKEAGMRVAVASSSPSRVVRRVLEARGLAPLFDVFVTGDEVARKKPDPEIFLLAAERCGVPPAHCLVLEDSMPGVLGAKRAGIPVIAVPEVDEFPAQRSRLEGRSAVISRERRGERVPVSPPDGGESSFVGVADAVVRDLVEARALVDWSVHEP